MKHIQTYNDFLNESLSSSDKKKIEDFFKHAVGKKCKIDVEGYDEEGILYASSPGLYMVKGGDMAIEPEYLLTSGDVKLLSASHNKIQYKWGDTWTIEIK